MNYHEPVMKTEVLENLRVKPEGKYIDCTLGDGGHTLEILEQGGKVLGLDIDDGSLGRTKERIGSKFENLILEKANFKDIDVAAKKHGFDKVDGILFDLGYSSTQLLDSEVGLSFMKDQPLDMRLNKELGVTAADLLNALSDRELEKLFLEYGEEFQAKKFAKAIVAARALKKFETTKELSDLLGRISSTHDRINPATKVFQALRIAVNLEFDNLRIALPLAAQLLLPGGRIIIISFHSLEDRIVKQFSIVQPGISLLTKKPILPSTNEVRQNPRSRSARLRVFEKQ